MTDRAMRAVDVEGRSGCVWRIRERLDVRDLRVDLG